MKKYNFFLTLLLFGFAVNAQNKTDNLVDYVNTLMGTKSAHNLSKGNTSQY